MSDFPHFSQIKIDVRPWLITGKGPSLTKWNPKLRDEYNIFSLNQSIWITKYADILHFIDYEYYEQTTSNEEITYKNILMPFYPHINEGKTNRSLLNLKPHHTNIFSYDLSTAGSNVHYPEQPIIHANVTSAQAAFNILGELGVKTIFSLGIDGTKYRYEPLSDIKIVNEHVDTTPQFNLINDYIKRYNINWVKL
jgi:hypothetical protein